MDVHDAVEDEIEGEVDRLKHVGRHDPEVEDLHVIGIDGVVVELQDLWRSDEDEEHADDRYHSRSDPASVRRRLRADPIELPHPTGLPQRPDQVDVAVGKRREGADETEDRPQIRECRFQGTIGHERTLVEDEVAMVTGLADDLDDLVCPVVGQFQNRPDEECYRNGDPGRPDPNQVARLQRAADGSVPTDCHDDRQPGTRMHESILRTNNKTWAWMKKK